MPEFKQFFKKVSYPIINSIYRNFYLVASRPLGIINVIVKKVPRSWILKLPYKEQLTAFMYSVGISRRNARCYIKSLNPEQFINELNKNDIKYVVLRWWDNFPHIEKNEDMDILMYEEDFLKIQHLITYKKNHNKCDIYLLNGKYPGHWNYLPYFPNSLFNDTVKTRILHNNTVYVPAPELHFATIAYHAIFHKGCKSGLPGFNIQNCGKNIDAEHNYPELLKKLAKEINLNIEINVKTLYDWLDEKGYTPNKDTLAKLIDVNSELSFLHQKKKYDYSRPEMAVFVIRETAVKDGLTNLFIEVFKSMNFSVLWVEHLDAETKKKTAKYLRGGKWDKAHYRISGGVPEKLIVTMDFHPRQMISKGNSNYNWFDNKNVLIAKQKCRKKLIQTKLFRDYNPIHCADNEDEAVDYLKIAMPDKFQDILAKADRMRQKYKTHYEVLKILSKGKRSKVELINYNGIKAIKKTFRLENAVFFERERFVLEKLGKKYSFVPELYEIGDCYFIIKYYDNILNFDDFKILRKQLSKYRNQVISIIESMYKEGYAYINFTPENLIITKSGTLKAIDFEFVQPYLKKPDSINDTFEVKGVPKLFNGDLPSSFDHRNSSFNFVWKDYVGKWEPR